MAIKAIKKQTEYKYIPIEERDEERPTTFVFKPMNKETKARLEDNLVRVNQDQTINISNASYILGAVKLCLVKVENFVDEEGKEIPVRQGKDGLVTDEFIELLPDDILQELGQAIINVSKYPEKASLFLGE